VSRELLERPRLGEPVPDRVQRQGDGLIVDEPRNANAREFGAGQPTAQCLRDEEVGDPGLHRVSAGRSSSGLRLEVRQYRLEPSGRSHRVRIQTDEVGEQRRNRRIRWPRKSEPAAQQARDRALAVDPHHQVRVRRVCREQLV